MIRENVVGDTPYIAPTSYADPSAVIIGRVSIGPGCYIGPSVVIRADRFSKEDKVSEIEIGANCGIQDLAVLHVHANQSLIIGDETIINHGAIIHGPSSIGNKCFVGCKSVITHTNIGDSVFIRSNTIIENVQIPSGLFIDINTAINCQDVVATLRSTTDKEKAYILKVINENKQYSISYKYSLEQ